MFGLLPPSSRVTRLVVAAAEAITSRPTWVEPVNDTFATPGCATSAAPARPSPVSTLSTPAGSPARSQIAARRSIVSGVCSAGLTTTVQPAASAGASLCAAVMIGKFHGRISAATPTGSSTV